MLGDHGDQAGDQHAVQQFFRLDAAHPPQKIQHAGHQPRRTGRRRGHDPMPRRVLLRRREGKRVQQHQEPFLRNPGHGLRINRRRAPLKPDRSRQHPFGFQSLFDRLAHDIQQFFQSRINFRFGKPAQGAFIGKDQFPRRHRIFFGQAYKRVEVPVTVRHRIDFRRCVAFPLDETASDRVIDFLRKHLSLFGKQPENQRIAVGKMVFRHVETDGFSGKGRRPPRKPGGINRVRVRKQDGQLIHGAGLRTLPEQSHPDGAIRAVSFSGQRERAEQFHLQVMRPVQLVRRELRQAFQKIASRLHRPDGVGAGRSRSHFENIEQAGLDAVHF
ncbi:MAG: hypothetical protein BWY31_04683 [Lentisphaerae bacterium ADurb.Bin242]|nr:MAG: hypothetical protein BWY31_04683 [Lentisphaerae bacterium ADurb.Bin242]